MRLLLVDDDPRTAKYLARALSESGHVVDHATDGASGLALASEGTYDLIVLERRLPTLDGLELVRRLRKSDPGVGVLMLSQSNTTEARVEALKAGCDDYLAKPYAYAEVLARLEAVGRRAKPGQRKTVLCIGDLTLDTESRRALRAGSEIRLQHREYLILEFLMRHAHEVVTRAMLLEAAWDYDFEPRGNIVDMHVHRLRRKVDEGFGPALIHTIAGAGYMLGEPKRSNTAADAPTPPG